MRTCSLLLIALAMSGSVALANDLVILNGRVMDPETMFDKVANVAIKDGRIVAITQDKITGTETIDATGLVVAPGFIDTHYHATDPFGQKLGLADGITTAMDIEHGILHAGEWYDNKAKEGALMNYGGAVASIGARMVVHDPEVNLDGPQDIPSLMPKLTESAKDGTMGWSVTRSDIDHMNQVMKILDEDLRQGALGIGVGAAYMARGLTTYEQFEMQRTAARYGRLTAVHTRFHLSSQTPTEAPIGVNEVLANAMLLKAPLLICHDNDYGWWENQEKLQMARAQGYNAWGEYYPFTAGSSGYGADYLRPELWEDTYGYKYEETLYDPLLDKFVTKDEYQNFVAKEPGRQVIVYFPKRAEWLPHWLKTPGMTVASDGMPGASSDGGLVPFDTDPSEYKGHPRVASTYSTTLKMAREANVPLMFTLTQLSYTSAKRLGDTGLKAMQERGRVQVGKIADLTIFDPEKVAPRATYKAGENGLPPVGIPYVVIGGKLAVKDSVIQDIKAGQPIRFPVEEKGRFEPVTVNGWFGTHTINTPALPAQDTTDAPAALEKTDKGAAVPQKTGSTAPKSPQTSDVSTSANGTERTTGAVAGWFGDAAGPRVSDAAFCPIHGVLERHSDAEKGEHSHHSSDPQSHRDPRLSAR